MEGKKTKKIDLYIYLYFHPPYSPIQHFNQKITIKFKSTRILPHQLPYTIHKLSKNRGPLGVCYITFSVAVALFEAVSES